MEAYSSTVLTKSPPVSHAVNVCAACREQKRRCDKTLPSCTRCSRLNRPCNYEWQSVSHSESSDSGSPSALLNWLLQPDLGNGLSDFDVDQLFTGIILRTLAEQDWSLTKVLEAYFRNIQTWLPVIIEQRFRDQASTLTYEPSAETALLLFAMFLVISVSNTTESRPGQNYNLFKHLYSFLQLRRVPSLRLVQSELLVALYETGSLSPEAASLSISNCARLGYSMKLNLNDKGDYTDYPAWEVAEERRRVWTGIYLLDRVVYQVVTEFNFSAPHAVEDLADHFQLPVDDIVLQKPEHELLQGTFHLPMSVPVDVPLCYYAREIQAVRILGHVQMLQRQVDIISGSLPEKFKSLDRQLMQFAEKLFEQTPRGWAVLCGANSITLTAALMLHQIRIDSAVKSQSDDATSSFLALSSFINMVRDICNKFNMLSALDKIDWVPLPAVVCTGEAVLAAIRMKEMLGDEYNIDLEPLRQSLLYARRSWKLADHYLQRMG